MVNIPITATGPRALDGFHARDLHRLPSQVPTPGGTSARGGALPRSAAVVSRSTPRAAARPRRCRGEPASHREDGVRTGLCSRPIVRSRAHRQAQDPTRRPRLPRARAPPEAGARRGAVEEEPDALVLGRPARPRLPSPCGSSPSAARRRHRRPRRRSSRTSTSQAHGQDAGRGRPDEEWTAINELVTRHRTPPFGPTSTQAGDRLMVQGRRVVPAILNG
jgi:hypothetical protein